MQPKFLSTLSAVLIAAQLASARIIGIIAPTTPLTPGVPFSVTLQTGGYPEENTQYYLLFGLAQNSFAHDGELFEVLGTGYDLVTNGHSNSNQIGSFDVEITIPSDAYIADPGVTDGYTLQAAVYGLAGAEQSVTVDYWTTQVTVD